METLTPASMRGQWLGSSTGTNAGIVIANFDELPDHYRGVAYMMDSNESLPGSGAIFRTEDKSGAFALQAKVVPVDPKTGLFTSWANIKHLFGPDMGLPEYADVTGLCNGDKIQLEWATPLGT